MAKLRTLTILKIQCSLLKLYLYLRIILMNLRQEQMYQQSLTISITSQKMKWRWSSTSSTRSYSSPCLVWDVKLIRKNFSNGLLSLKHQFRQKILVLFCIWLMMIFMSANKVLKYPEKTISLNKRGIWDTPFYWGILNLRQIKCALTWVIWKISWIKRMSLQINSLKIEWRQGGERSSRMLLSHLHLLRFHNHKLKMLHWLRCNKLTMHFNMTMFKTQMKPQYKHRIIKLGLLDSKKLMTIMILVELITWSTKPIKLMRTRKKWTSWTEVEAKVKRYNWMKNK